MLTGSPVEALVVGCLVPRDQGTQSILMGSPMSVQDIMVLVEGMNERVCILSSKTARQGRSCWKQIFQASQTSPVTEILGMTVRPAPHRTGALQ